MKNEAEKIGAEIILCKSGCQGANVDIQAGILPRCLFFEKRNGTSGAIIVGLNPGLSSEDERNFYQENGVTYAAIYEFWNKNNTKIPYYNNMRRLVDALGFDGSLWWTELAKCEPLKDVNLSIQTLRYCGGQFLHRELQAVPKQWPVLAVGRQAFNALSFLLPDRNVLGIPHPTGSHGHFNSLFENGILSEKINKLTRECLAAPLAQAVWLTG